MFVRRRIHIESMNVCASGVQDVQRFTIVINETEDETRKLMLQIDKQVEVFKTFFNRDIDVVWQQQVLYKVAGNFDDIPVRDELTKYGVRRIENGEDYTVYEATGSEETIALVEKVLEPLGIIDMAKTARSAVAKSNNNIHKKLKQLLHQQHAVANVETEYV